MPLPPRGPEDDMKDLMQLMAEVVEENKKLQAQAQQRQPQAQGASAPAAFSTSGQHESSSWKDELLDFFLGPKETQYSVPKSSTPWLDFFLGPKEPKKGGRH